MGKMIKLTTDLESLDGLAPIQPRGPVVPVRRGKRTVYLRDGRWLPGWLVWLRRRRVALALLVLGVGGALLAARLLLAEG